MLQKTPDPSLTISRVETSSALDDFIRAPWRVYADDPAWRAPLLFERKQHLSPKSNPAMARLEHAMWVARRGGEPVGRISAQIDPLAEAHQGSGLGHFGFIEGIDSESVFDGLFGAAEAWLRERGANRVQGPFNWTINQECGLLVDGFDTPPQIMMPHGRPYYGRHLDRLGYAKAADTFAFLYRGEGHDTPTMRRAVAAAKKHEGLTVRPLNMKRFDEEVRNALMIFNGAWAGNWGFIPFTDEEIDHAIGEMRPLLTADMGRIAELNGEPVGFAILLPNVNELARGLNGRLLPFGWSKLLYRLKVKGPRSVRLPLFGVHADHLNTRFGSLVTFYLLQEIADAFVEQGFDEVEMSWVLEKNTALCRINEHFGAPAYKTYRIYEKALP